MNIYSYIHHTNGHRNVNMTLRLTFEATGVPKESETSRKSRHGVVGIARSDGLDSGRRNP